MSCKSLCNWRFKMYRRPASLVTALILLLVIAGTTLHAASVTVVVPSNVGPWFTNGGLNTAYPYSVGDYQAPIVLTAASGLGFNPGDQLTFTYLSGMATVYCGGGCGWWHDANGDGYPFNGYGNAIGSSGTREPAYYINAGTGLGGLVGVFTDGAGAIVGSPLWVGVGPVTYTVPFGATQFQLGITDDIFADNAGSYTIRVDGSSVPEPTTFVMLFGGITALIAKRYR